MITGKAIHPLGKHGKFILKLGKQEQVLCLHLATLKSLLPRTEGLSEQFEQSCSKWEDRLEPENMGETELFLNTLLELRINIIVLLVNGKVCCQSQPLPQLLAQHCHVSQSWRAVSHLS